MGRKPKNLKATPPPLEKQTSNPQSASADSALSQNENNIFIEDHSPVSRTEPDSAWEKIKSAAARTGFLTDEEEPRIENRGRKKKTAATDEFATLIISVLVLILSFSNMPEQIKPNDSELRVLANHLAGLMIRHMPISSKFSADSLDIIGIFAVVSGYYARVSPAIKELQAQKPKERIAPAQNREVSDKTQNTEFSRVIDPIERLSPATAQFLDEVEKRNHANKNA